MGVKNDIFWSEIGSGFGEPGGTPPPRIPRSSGVPFPIGHIFFFLIKLNKFVIFRSEVAAARLKRRKEPLGSIIKFAHGLFHPIKYKH